jgi:polyprenyldihydroxybenzoate methyltransferase / 3-demethylubiquinol 3-O-methyltransferase
MNPARIQFIRTKLHEVALDEQLLNFNPVKPLHRLDVLDVGCGGGLLSEVLSLPSPSCTIQFIPFRA